MTTTVEPSSMPAPLAKARAAKAAPADKWAERETLVKRLAAARAALKGCRARKRPFALQAKRGSKAAGDRLAGIDRDQASAAAAVQDLELAIEGLDAEIEADGRREKAASLRSRLALADGLVEKIVDACHRADAAVDALVAALERRAKLMADLRSLRLTRSDFATMKLSSDPTKIMKAVLAPLSTALPIDRQFFADDFAQRVAEITHREITQALAHSRPTIEAEIAELEAEPDKDEEE